MNAAISSLKSSLENAKESLSYHKSIFQRKKNSLVTELLTSYQTMATLNTTIAELESAIEELSKCPNP
jgi:peptidoglycan hydrolase CwlO-like protein